MKPTFFATPAAFRRWLAKHHERETELLVGFYRKTSGRPSITWPESVDEALCYGWIDGIRRSLDDDSYTIRFTPRRPTSYWSRVNVARATALIEAGRMQPAGLAAFHRRDPAKQGNYSFERDTAELPPAYVEQFQRNAQAWQFFQAQPPGYRKLAAAYVIGAKKEETRVKRLGQLIDDSADGRRLAQTLPSGKARP